MKKRFILPVVLVTMAVIAGCASQKETKTDQEQSSKKQEIIMVAAAASLEKCFTQDLIPMFEKEHGNVKVEGTYDSSGKLQTQIEAGLDADIFFSAAEKQMNALVEEDYIAEGDVVNLLKNGLVLITGKGSQTSVTGFEDITKSGTIAVGDPASVPAGQYAREAFESIGIWDEVSKKASLGTNVTEVLNWVAAQSAETGVVYATDAASNENVEVIATAKEEWLETPVIYPVATLKASEDKESVKEFMAFLQTPEAKAVFEKYGFTWNN